MIPLCLPGWRKSSKCFIAYLLKNLIAAPLSPVLRRFIKLYIVALVNALSGPFCMYPVALGRYTKCLKIFFQINRIPVGPIIFLREWGISLRKPWPRRAEEHKRELIDRMLTLYNDMPCILIGDSGQHDPEVYTEIVKAYPDRIKAIYIRQVDKNPRREQAIQRLRDRVGRHPV